MCVQSIWASYNLTPYRLSSFTSRTPFRQSGLRLSPYACALEVCLSALVTARGVAAFCLFCSCSVRAGRPSEATAKRELTTLADSLARTPARTYSYRFAGG